MKGESLGYQKTSYQWVIVGVLWLIHALLFVNLSGFGILAPYIKEELHLSSFQIGFLISSLSIGGSFQPNAVGTARRFHGCAPDDEPGARLSSGREEKRDPVRDHLGPLVLFDE